MKTLSHYYYCICKPWAINETKWPKNAAITNTCVHSTVMGQPTDPVPYWPDWTLIWPLVIWVGDPWHRQCCTLTRTAGIPHYGNLRPMGCEYLLGLIMGCQYGLIAALSTSAMHSEAIFSLIERQHTLITHPVTAIKGSLERDRFPHMTWVWSLQFTLQHNASTPRPLAHHSILSTATLE